MFSKVALASLAGSILIGCASAFPTLNATTSNTTYTFDHPPVNADESQTMCSMVGEGKISVPAWYWKDLHKGFRTRTDIFLGNRKLRFAKFGDQSCGTCPHYPQGPRDFQIGNVDKLASGKCKTFQTTDPWNSFMFNYGDKLSECRIDVFDRNHCVGTITHSYYGDDEQTCQKIPGGGKSVFVTCGVGRTRFENIRISEVTSCQAVLGLNDDADTQPTDDDDPDDQAGGVRKIRSSVKQDFMELPTNATSFSFFKEQDCGSCGGSGEMGQGILLRNQVCQSIEEDFLSFFYKVGDNVQNANIKVYSEPNCAGIASTFDQWDQLTCQSGAQGQVGRSVMVTYDIAPPVASEQ